MIDADVYIRADSSHILRHVREGRTRGRGSFVLGATTATCRWWKNLAWGASTTAAAAAAAGECVARGASATAAAVVEAAAPSLNVYIAAPATATGENDVVVESTPHTNADAVAVGAVAGVPL